MKAADYGGVGDGEGGCSGCSDTSGVAAGEAIAGDGDAVGDSSFSDEGAGINESRELLVAFGVCVAVGIGLASAFVDAGPGFRGVASM